MSLPQVSQLASAASDTQTVNYVVAAAASWVVYDALLTAQEEIEYLRVSRWGLNKILYICLRLFTIGTLTIDLTVWGRFGLTTEFCRGFLKWQELFSASPSLYLGQALLLLRICALYRGTRKVILLAVGLYIFYFAFLTLMIVLEATAIDVMDVPAGLVPLPGCWMATNYTRWSNVEIVFGTMDIIISTGYFVLTLHKFIEANRRAQLDRMKVTTLLNAGGMMPTVFRFFRDGASYYLAILVCQIIQVVFLTAPNLADRPITNLGFPLTIGTYFVATSRLLHSLRKGLSPQKSQTEIELSRVTNGPLAFGRVDSEPPQEE